MGKLPMRSEGSPNRQKQRALQREHKKQLARLHERNLNDRAKPNAEAKDEERSDAT
jgi:hypothetical protein